MAGPLSADAWEDQMLFLASHGYQEGLQTAKEGLKNQKLWEKNQGDPEMTKAYQEGLHFDKTDT